MKVELLVDSHNLDSLEFFQLSLDTFLGCKEIEEETDRNDDIYSNYMTKGTKFGMPLWMVVPFASMKFVNMQVPKYYQREFLNLALADAEIANLRNKNEYFYEIGHLLAKKLKNFFIIKSLNEIFLQRLKRVILIILHSNLKETPTAFIYKLANCEQEFYEMGMELISEYKVWKVGKTLQNNQYKVMAQRKRLKLN